MKMNQMGRSIWKGAFLFGVSLPLFFSCGKKEGFEEKKQEVRINIGADPTSLDPRKARDLISISLVRMFFEGLTRISPSGSIENGLAEAIELSEDGLQYTFRLRDSFWSNGEAVTSFDFAQTWRTILDPRFPTDIAYQLYPIKNGRKGKLGEIDLEEIGIQTPDSSTLVVDLEQPVPYFLELLSMPSFFPVFGKGCSDPNWEFDPELYVCNGPFKPVVWNHSDRIRAEKNPLYWEEKQVALDFLELLMMSQDAEVQMFEEGKLDWAGSPLSTLPVDAMSELKKSQELRMSPFSGTYFFRLNTAEQIGGKKNPLSSPSFRKALGFALNREKITEHLLQGGEIPASRLTPPGMGLFSEEEVLEPDSEQARRFLIQSLLDLDLKGGAIDPLRIRYSTSSERNRLIAQAAQQDWEKELGLKVEIEGVEPKVFFQRVSDKDFQLAAGSWTADFNDPVNFLEVFKYKNGGTNNTDWENSKYIDLLNRSGLCRNWELRRAILREAEQILMDEMPIIPLFHFSLNYLQREGLEEVALSPLGQIDFRWAHFDSKEGEGG